MSTSRIEVPLTLPPPHFDDDATIATARQVVPIKGGRKILAGRRVLTLLPLLIASTLCGALGAFAVNYFERRPETAASATPEQPLPHVSTQATTESTSVVIAPESNAKNTEIQASVQPEETVSTADESPAKSEAPKITKREDEEKREDPARKSAPPAPAKREPAEDAAKLVRKRRVQPPDSETPLRRNRRSAASRIEDLFTGPNP